MSIRFYVQADDELVITAQTRQSGVGIMVTAYLVTVDAKRVLMSHRFALSGAGAIDTFRMRPGAGLIETLQASISTGTVRQGQVAVQANVQRASGGESLFGAVSRIGFPSTNTPSQLLMESSDMGGFSGWYPVGVLGSDPAAGSEITETVPAGVLWRLRHLRTQFTADAAVASRRPLLLIDDGSNIFYSMPVFADITAGQTRHILAGFYGQVPSVVQDRSVIGLPDDLTLFPGWRVRTATVNMQAGDDYGAPHLLLDECLSLVGY